MTVVGILGCTSLMLAGFGIRDSIIIIPDKQYKDIFTFDEMVYVTSSTDEQIDKTFNNKHITNKVYTNMSTNMMVEGYNINMFVPLNNTDLYSVMKLRDVKTKEILKLEDNKVIISDKLSRLTNKKVGDKITLKESSGQEHTFTISGVCENYVGHYIFMSKKTYELNIGNYETNIVYLDIDDLKNEEITTKREK